MGKMKNSKLAKLLRYAADPDYRFLLRAYRGRYRQLSDEAFVLRMFKATMGYTMDLQAPKTFNEKLQWLKLYNRRPEYTQMVDKYGVKDYVRAQIGDACIIPTLGVWDTPEEIAWNELPEQFVLKVTHDSGGLVICKDKARFNVQKAKERLRKSLAYDYYGMNREWPYKHVKRRIIAEQYLEEPDGSPLRDYKFHCFGGVPRVILVCQGRDIPGGMTEDFFDPQWRHLELSRKQHPHARQTIAQPRRLQQMLAYAAQLSAGIPFLRVDFYEVDGHVFFGELTFFPSAGFSPFVPQRWDERMGEWIALPDAAVE